MYVSHIVDSVKCLVGVFTPKPYEVKKHKVLMGIIVNHLLDTVMKNDSLHQIFAAINIQIAQRFPFILSTETSQWFLARFPINYILGNGFKLYAHHKLLKLNHTLNGQCFTKTVHCFHSIYLFFELFPSSKFGRFPG